MEGIYLHDNAISSFADVREVRVARSDLEDLAPDDLSIGVGRCYSFTDFSHC